MNYSETKEQSGEYLRMALSHLAKHDLPVDPLNYSVWYEYVSGKNKMLTTIIDEFINQAKSISPDVNKYLYQRFIADEMAALSEKMLKELRRVIRDMSKNVKNSGCDINKHGDALENFAFKLSRSVDYQEFSKIIDAISKETRALVKTSRAMKSTLELTQKELDIMKLKLKATREEATTDTLTGLTNRRGFENLIVNAISEANRSQSSLCLLMADIDHFKKINDTFGHLAGDSVLKIIANTIKDFTKGRDSVCRYGGEEFIVILPDTPIKGAVALGEKIRKFLESMNWKNKATGESLGTITISMGISQYRLREPAESMIHRADRALYLSKDNGRNQITVEQAESHLERFKQIHLSK